MTMLNLYDNLRGGNVDRLDLYLQWNVGDTYTNTDKEEELVNKFVTLYELALSAKEQDQFCNSESLDRYRRAYLGTLNALTKDGKESKRDSRKLRKVIYELIESKVDNSIPLPKIKPRYKDDLPLVGITEEYLKYEMDDILTKYINDKSERSTYIDGTSWYKVSWDAMASTHERSGDVRIELCTADQIVPQPGVTDYKQLEYIFERKNLSLSKIYDLYGRKITPIDHNTNVVEVISCYYLNENHVVGLFMWASHSRQVICNEKDWQIRKLRVCTKCGAIIPAADTCGNCGSKSFKYENATVDVLSEDLYEIYNPYEVGETDDETQRDRNEARVFLTAGTEIPFYQVRQLPFVPRVAISAPNSIYGISEVFTLLETQDAINKIYTKAVEKSLSSGAVVTKPEKMKINDDDTSFKIFGVRSPEEAAMVQAKQIMADISQELAMSALLYDSAKSSSGVTDSFQGKQDTTATSGKAKEYSAMQTAGRLESLRVMKSASFAGLYELVLKYLLAFSDEPRKFVRILPDGTEKEETWNKYMFLNKDKYGDVYYREDFKFDSDPASTLSQNRIQMWQETQNQFIQGTFGTPTDPRVLKLFWNTMDSLQYPLAKNVLAGIKENEQHLPAQIEQAIMQNPQIMQAIAQMIDASGEQRGGARPNSGPAGNGFTHSANVDKTNLKNSTSQGLESNEAFSPQMSGGNV